MGGLMMNILLEQDLLLLAGLILSGLAGGVLGAIAARPRCAFLRDAAGFLAGAAMGAGLFGAAAWAIS